MEETIKEVARVSRSALMRALGDHDRHFPQVGQDGLITALWLGKPLAEKLIIGADHMEYWSRSS